jgi:hypothetical protein
LKLLREGRMRSWDGTQTSIEVVETLVRELMAETLERKSITEVVVRELMAESCGGRTRLSR